MRCVNNLAQSWCFGGTPTVHDPLAASPPSSGNSSIFIIPVLGMGWLTPLWVRPGPLEHPIPLALGIN